MTTKNKIVAILTSVTLLIAILATSAWAINRYVYDLLHYLPMVGDYKEKSISVINRVSDYRGDVGAVLDFMQIENDLRENANYQVKLNRFTELLVIKRNFDDKEYEIVFIYNKTNHTVLNTLFSLDVRGEPSTEPDYSIEQRAFGMIDGLPITETQKENIKNNIEVRGISTRHWGN